MRVVADAGGQRLQVDGRDFMVLGMNWDYLPIGENYNYSLWNQPDALIVDALDSAGDTLTGDEACGIALGVLRRVVPRRGKT